MNIEDFFDDLLVACVAGFFKSAQLEQIMKGKVDTKEKLFCAFDNFTLGLKVPKFLLLKKLSSLEGKREQLFIKGLLLHIDEN